MTYTFKTTTEEGKIIQFAAYTILKQYIQHIYYWTGANYEKITQSIYFARNYKDEAKVFTMDNVGNLLAHGHTPNISSRKIITDIHIKEFESWLAHNLKPEKIILRNTYTIFPGLLPFVGGSEGIYYEVVDENSLVRETLYYILHAEPPKPLKIFSQLVKQPDEQKAHKILNLLQQYNTTYQRAVKTVLAFTVASLFKLWLYAQGWDYYPILLLVGRNNKGKSRLANFFAKNIFNIPDSNDAIFLYGGVSKLKNVIPTTTPLVLEEFEQIYKSPTFENLKNSLTSSCMEVTLGRSGRLRETFAVYNTFIATANKFDARDTAWLDRIYQLDCDVLPPFTDEELSLYKKLSAHSNNIYDLAYFGAWLVNKLQQLSSNNLQQFLTQAKETAMQQVQDRTSREWKKVVFTTFGELLLNHVGVLHDIQIFLPMQSALVSDERDTLISLILSKLDDIVRRADPTLSLAAVLESKLPMHIWKSLKSAGVIFSYHNNPRILIKRMFVDDKFQRHGFKTLPQIASVLGLEYKAQMPYKTPDGKFSTTTAVDITPLIEEEHGTLRQQPTTTSLAPTTTKLLDDVEEFLGVKVIGDDKCS